MAFQPIAIYKVQKADGAKTSNLVWANVFEGRYCVEVQHTGAHKANLIIFDSRNQFRVLHEEPVTVNWDGSPLDPVDVEAWTNMAGSFIDDYR